MNMSTMITALALLAVSAVSGKDPECPASHPNAYSDGRYCCKSNKEKYYGPLGSKCDGSVIQRDSKCCEGDQYTRCRSGNCQSYSGEPLECPASHPNAYSNGRYCCKSNKEKYYGPHGSKCDGSVIQRDSECCEGDQHTTCPNGNCQSYSGEPLECPASHPNAYSNGRYCCKSNKEKYYGPHGSKCDGSVIQRDSECCEGDQHTTCPNGNCQSYSGEPLECPASHPYAYSDGQYCCKSNKEKYYGPQGSKCDGSVIQRDSKCCEGDQYRTCPNGNCENYQEVCGCDNINGDDYEATDIEYDMDNKIVTAVRPDFIVNKELTNRGSRDLVVPLSQQVEVWKMMEFSHTSGATVKVGTSFNVGVPGLGGVGVSAEVSGSYSFSSGEQTTTKKIITVKFSCTAPPKKRAVCNAMMRKDKVSIPYVMTWTHKRLNGCTCTEEGLFEELVSNNVEMDVQEYDLNTKKMIRTKREEILDLQTI
ncbi:papilin-like [Bolinopsis microptera]|uniref:papilin-like n=1 Tax=Bolinopsis microptera TaxID=2820187 RepID=UPI003079220D